MEKSRKWVHEYFDRRSSEWTITEFLEECDTNLFTEKIGRYLTSLESIINNEDGCRSRKAQELYSRYKQGSRPDRQIARDWLTQKAQKSKETAGTSINLHHPTFTGSSLGIGTINGGEFNAGPSRNVSRNKTNDNIVPKKKMEDYFSVIPPLRPSNLQQSMSPEIQEDSSYVISDDNDNEDTNDADHTFDNKSTYMEDPNYFDTLIDNVDLSYIGREEEPVHGPLTSTISMVNSRDSFKIDDIDVLKIFGSLRNSLPKKSPEVHPQYWGVIDLTGQHKPTKRKFISKWNELVNNFKLDIAWKMAELDQYEMDFFDNIEVITATV